MPIKSPQFKPHRSHPSTECEHTNTASTNSIAKQSSTVKQWSVNHIVKSCTLTTLADNGLAHVADYNAMLAEKSYDESTHRIK